MTITEIPCPDQDSPNEAQPRGVVDWTRRLIFGKPISSEQSESSQLGKLLGLPVFCTDGISSVAYGTQQILLALCTAGLWAPQYAGLYGHYTMMLSFAIAVLLVIVAASYWQTIFAYPNGGGSYTVSRENLGQNFGLVAAAALLIDYTLTVSVSVASGLQNLKDVPAFAFMHIDTHLVLYCILAIIVMTVANLRGMRESGTLFAIPVYTFIVMAYLLIFVGVAGPFLGWHFHPEFVNQVMPTQQTKNMASVFSLAVILRAFANGCSAMTGVEAVSNGTPAFKEPKSKNAAIVLATMAIVLGTIFIGVSWLAVYFHVVYWEFEGATSPAVIDQISGAIFGKTGFWSVAYTLMQVATALILIIAAQTSFAGFPRLASVLARDGFMAKQFTFLGDKLAFNNGIVILGILSSILIIMEKGSVDRLIPFFAIGVFVAFTLSQAGMVSRSFKLRGPGWQRKGIINGIGSLACLIVVINIAAEKFFEGAWFVIIVMITLVFVFTKTQRHYTKMAQLLDPKNYHPATEHLQNTVIVLLQGVHAGSLAALDYARSLSSDCKAVYVAIQPDLTPALKASWEQYVPDIPLVILDSSYRSLIGPLVRYIDTVHKEQPNHRLTIVIPEFVTTKWWQEFLHGHTGLILKLILLGRRDVIVANVRYWLADC